MAPTPCRIPEDAELLAAVASGDHPALLALYDRYSRIAYGLAYRILHEAGAAEEAVQDAFLRIWRYSSTFDPARDGGRAWLLTIVRHSAIGLVRRQGGVTSRVVSLGEMTERRIAAEVSNEDTMSSEQECVRNAVATLPGAQRHVIELAYFTGLTHGEIAQREGLPLGTVKSRLRLGLRHLSRLLADQDCATRSL
jgi:RNA polymerase sigma-70 factor (ECF subfamily)